MSSKPLNISIDEYTSPIDLTASEDMTIAELQILIRDKTYRHIPVVSEGRPVGILSDRDLALLSTLNNSEEMKVKDVMVEDPYCVYNGAMIDDVVFEMVENKIGSALVLDNDNKLDSIFTSIDAMNALIEIVRGQS